MQSKNQLLRNFQEILNNNIEIIYTYIALTELVQILGGLFVILFETILPINGNQGWIQECIGIGSVSGFQASTSAYLLKPNSDR